MSSNDHVPFETSQAEADEQFDRLLGIIDNKSVSPPRYYHFGRRDRYYIDSTGYISEHDADPEVEPQHGEVPRFIAEEMLRLRDLYVDAATIERNRIRAELINWLVGTILPCDAGLINGRRIVDEIDRICPKE